MTIPELLQKRAALGEQARAVILTAQNEARGLKPEEVEKYDKMKVDIDGLTDLINRERSLSAATGELNPVEDKKTKDGKAQFESRMQQERARMESHRQLLAKPEYEDAFHTYLRFGKEDLTPDQSRVLYEARVASPLSDVTGAAGAYLIPQGFYTTLTDAMKWFGGMRASNATVIRTATGNALPFPTANDTGNTGELIAENTAATQASTEMAFGQVVLGAYKYSSKYVLVPIELLQDSYFDVGAFIAKKLGERIGRITNNHFTVGTGSSQPKGIVPAATAGVTGTTGQTLTVIYDDLINLIHSIDPAYRAGAQWMYNDATAAKIELLKDGNNRPLVNSSLVGIANEVSGGAIDQRKFLLGYEVVVNNDMAVMAANAKSILFGATSSYFIREVMDIQLVRFQELYMNSGQVGFLAFYRADGNLIDAGTHPVKYYANSAT